MKFQPWIDFESDESPVDAPPCPYCVYWSPKRQHEAINGRVFFNGVVLCHAKEMERDFSCYRAKDNA